MSSSTPNSGDGWLVVDALLDGAAISAVLEDMERLLAEPPEHRHAGDKPASGTRHLEALDARSTPVADLLGDPRLGAAVDEFMANAGAPVQVSYRSPQPGYGSQYLHADDMPRLADTPTAVVTAIVALTEFTATNGATRLVPGSHDRPDLQRDSGRLADHADAVTVTVPAGSAIVFNGHLLHSGTQNDSDAERPALQIVWRAGSSA